MILSLNVYSGIRLSTWKAHFNSQDCLGNIMTSSDCTKKSTSKWDDFLKDYNFRHKDFFTSVEI